MSLDALLKELEEAHAKSTQGEWQDIAAAESDNIGNYIELTVHRANGRNWKPFGATEEEFCCLAHNYMPKLLEVIQILGDGLKEIRSGYEENSGYWSERRAQDALAQADQIAKEDLK